MIATVASSVHYSRSSGMSGGALLASRGMPLFRTRDEDDHPPRPRAIVHVVGFDEDMQGPMCDLFACVGMATKTYADVGAFVRGDLPDIPGCLLVHARVPLIRGLEFLVHFERPREGLPIVVVADRSDVRTAVFAMKAGAVDFLEKPLRDQDVLDAIGAAIRIDQERRHAETLRAELKTRFARLTPRERQVMALVTQGLLNKQVAGDLGLSEITVKVHRGAAMRKMGARTLAELVRMADALADPA